MRITELRLEGPAGNFATLKRKRDCDTLEIQIITPRGEQPLLRPAADDKNDLWSAAEAVQEALDGYPGAGGDIREYFRVIETLCNQ